MDANTALRARNDLLDVADAWDGLLARLTPQKGAGGRAAAPASRPPIDLGTSELLGEITTTTHTYARQLIAEAGWTPATTVMPGLLTAVAERFGHFTTDPDRAETFAADAAHLRAATLRTLNPAAPARWLGPCPTTECPGELYLRAGRTTARCPACGRETDLTSWRAALRAAFTDRLMSRAELTSALHVLGATTKRRTLDKWVQRRRLVPAITDPELFRFADAVELAAPHAAPV